MARRDWAGAGRYPRVSDNQVDLKEVVPAKPFPVAYVTMRVTPQHKPEAKKKGTGVLARGGLKVSQRWWG